MRSGGTVWQPNVHSGRGSQEYWVTVYGTEGLPSVTSAGDGLGPWRSRAG
jgi:hypothetical protein